MFRKLYLWTAGLVGHPRAEIGLGAISFVESSVFPIPADVLFIPMCLTRPDKVWRYALIATITSVLGGIFGWMLGHYAFDAIGRPLLEAMGKMDTFEKLKGTQGDLAILVMLVTAGLAHVPPMKVVTILAGVISFDPVLFVLSAIIARGGRFYGLAWLLSRYGVAIVHFVQKRMAWIALAILIVIGIAIYFLKG